MQVDILLATYNGEKFIRQQLDSLLEQTYQGWRLLAHDDGSTDNTVSILKEYSDKYPDQIFVIEDGIKCGGAKNNFSHLMTFSCAPYVMFCDQDDVWLKNKIELTFRQMEKLEAIYPGKPILIHTDLIVVDEELREISDSMFSYQRLSKNTEDLDELLVQNNITGCTMMINKSALSISIPIPDAAIMHDWWIGCNVLHSSGIICFIPDSLIKYRQHGGNAVGSKEINWLYYLLKFKNVGSVFYSYVNILNQARLFNRGFPVKLFLSKIKILKRRILNDI